MTTEERVSSGSAAGGNDVAKAYEEIRKAEIAAKALESMLDNIENKMNGILSDEAFLEAEAAMRRFEEAQAQLEKAQAS